MLQTIDYCVIGFYFLFLAGLGWYFRSHGGDSSDYFRGGGRMPWWLVGAGAFMGTFSAWTFTGAAGLAYKHGFVVLAIYAANAVSFFVAACWFARWFRQTRAITVMEAVRQRLGFANEQTFTWLQLPFQVIVAAIWLYGLAIFLSPVFHIDLPVTILACGVIVILVATLGGSWAVITGDFMQALLLMPVTLVIAWLALAKVGGFGSLIDKLPSTHVDFTASNVSGFGWLWLAALFIEKTIIFNGLPGASKFLCVRDSRDASRAALFGGVLFALGSVIWFIPPLAARALGMDMAARFPGLHEPAEAAYAAIALDTLPPGLLGLLVTGIIAATVSSMDTGLNRNAGIFVRSVYLPLLRPQAKEGELVLAGKAVTLGFGVLIISIALLYNTWGGAGVFELMFNIAAMLLIPSAVPMFWCLFTRRSPDWAAWSAVLAGLAVSALLGVLPKQPWVHSALPALGGFFAWITANSYAAITLANLLVCSAWFWAATAWKPQSNPSRQTEVDSFFHTLKRLIGAAETAGDHWDDTPHKVTRLCLVYGVFLGVLSVLPNTLAGHAGLGVCAGFFFATAALLRWLSPRRAPALSNPPAVQTDLPGSTVKSTF